tara:strand:- start:870 stop:1190 length:321 start_codon:yes stop_codon:yes gene_type:complete
MSDLFNDFNKIFKKDLVPIFIKYLKDPNNKISKNINNLIENPQTFLQDIFEKFSQNKDFDNNQESYVDNVTDTYAGIDVEYEDLLKRLIEIEENMVQIEKILKEKN